MDSRPSPREDFPVPSEVARHAAWHRLEDQLGYYGGRSRSFRGRYLTAKVLQILLGGAIPVMAVVPGLDPDLYRLLSALFGAAVAAIEGLLQLFQWHALWLQYRLASERLKRERWRLLAGAEPYGAPVTDAMLAALAVRVEAVLATEFDAWMGAMARPAAKSAGGEPQPQGG